MEGPGPAAYDGSRNYKVTQKAGPGWKMGTDIKEVVDRTTRVSVPGSGAYDIPQKLEKKGGAMPKSKRFEETKSSTPGAGAYTVPKMVAQGAWHMKK